MKNGSILYSGKMLPSFIYCGKKICAPGELHVRRTFPSFNIQICEKGCIGINEAGIEYSINAGEFLIMTPDLLHYGIYPQEKDAVIYFIHFMPDEEWKLSSEKEESFFNITNHGLGIYCPSFDMSILKYIYIKPLTMQTDQSKHFKGGILYRCNLIVTKIF